MQLHRLAQRVFPKVPVDRHGRFSQTASEMSGTPPDVPKDWHRVLQSKPDDQLTQQAFNYLEYTAEHPFDPKVEQYHWQGLATAVQHQQAYVVTAPASIRTVEAVEPFLNHTIQQFASLPPTKSAEANHKALVVVLPGLKVSWPLNTALHFETTSQLLYRHHISAAQLGPKAPPYSRPPSTGWR